MSKKFLIGMTVLLSASLFFLGCPTGNEDDGGGTDSKSPVAVSGAALNLTSLVVKPVKNVAPKTDAIDKTEYAGTIAWKNSDGTDFTGDTFAVSTVYKAVVTLTAKPDYTFTGVAANAFSHTDADSAAGSVANDANSGTVTITFPATAAAGEDTVVSGSALDLTALVVKPVKDAEPNSTAIDETEYTGSIAWKNSDGTDFDGAAFAAGTVYKAVVTLTAKPDYTFTGVAANAFSHTDADSSVATPVANDANSGTVTITFPATAAADEDTVVYGAALNLTALVDKPVKNAEPDTDAINETQYEGSIAWKNSDNSDFTGDKFAAGTVYKAVVTLTAKPGYTFTGVGANAFSHDDADSTATPPVANDANSGTVTITFPATAAAGVDTVVSGSALNLTSLVDKPVKNAEPDTDAINETQYTGSIAWKNSDNSNFTGDTFAAGTVYKAVVTLTAKPDYTFDGVGANAFSHDDAASAAGSVANAADSGVVTITFPATAAAGENTVVYALNLTALVDKPVKNAEPDTDAINETQYTGSIAWKNSDNSDFTGDTFAAGTVYKAVVTLAAKADYTFDGIAVNAFSHAYAASAAGSVANDADSGTVTITFPATEVASADVQVSGAALVLTELVTKPVKDAEAQTTFTAQAEYTGSIAWKTVADATHTGKFAANTVYKAVVTLVAVDGYTFAGLGTDAFTHTGGAAVFDAGTGVVTITFPITANPGVLPVTIDFGYAPIPVSGTENAIVLAKTDAAVALTVSGGYTVTGWYVDGKKIEGDTTNTLQLNPATYNIRKHSVTVEATKDGKPYSRTVPFTVTAAGL
ncbi:MAG: hypothetical protein LBK61_06000 [Spirochaetaceae bacterium]|jgi:hypothetical protein|nr:hypothetical protein [Spirochaetaceae bacterium]